MKILHKLCALITISLIYQFGYCRQNVFGITDAVRPNVRAEIIAIGDELCYGKVYDTNSYWIADQLTQRGVLVQRIVCVRDELDEICSVLRDALIRKPRFIFTTGGLGPTNDDKTREALSIVTGKKIVARPEMLDSVAERRKIPVENLPGHFTKITSSLEGATCLPNPAGVAPVTIIDQGGTRIISLPGPPREVYACFDAHVAQTVQKETMYHSISRRVLVRMPESELAPMMTSVTKENPGTYVKALVGEYEKAVGMPVEIMAFGPSEERCREICEKAVEMLRRLAAEKGKNLTEIPEEKK